MRLFRCYVNHPFPFIFEFSFIVIKLFPLNCGWTCPTGGCMRDTREPTRTVTFLPPIVAIEITQVKTSAASDRSCSPRPLRSKKMQLHKITQRKEKEVENNFNPRKIKLAKKKTMHKTWRYRSKYTLNYQRYCIHRSSSSYCKSSHSCCMPIKARFLLLWCLQLKVN